MNLETFQSTLEAQYDSLTYWTGQQPDFILRHVNSHFGCPSMYSEWKRFRGGLRISVFCDFSWWNVASDFTKLIGKWSHGSRCTRRWLKYHKSEPRSYAIGLMAKDENSERERREKKKQCAELTACDSSSIPHHVIDYQSGSMVSLWGWYRPVAQAEVVLWRKDSYPEPLAKWSNARSTRTICGSLPNRGSWLIAQFILPSYGSRHCPYATDAGVLRTPFVVGF